MKNEKNKAKLFEPIFYQQCPKNGGFTLKTEERPPEKNLHT